MGTLADIPLIDAVGHYNDQSSLPSLLEVLCGRPVAVDLDNNPFLKRPEDLTENAWYLVRSDQSRDSEAALWTWRPKGEARQIMLDLPKVCWEIIHEFHETDNQKTNWIMLEYKITLPDESFSICKIWQDPASHVQVGRSIPFDNNQQHSVDDYQVENPPSDLDIFTSGDYLELLDLEAPLFPFL